MSDGLNRHLAPISGAAWQVVDAIARDTLEVWLAGRRLVDFTGPLGWAHSAVSTGMAHAIDGFGKELQVHRREIQPLLELRVPFRLSREELDSVDRGNPAPPLDPLVDAARRIAAAEDRLVFDGLPSAGIRGLHTHAENEPQIIEHDYNAYPRTVAQAIQRLRSAGIAGPYALALGPRCWEGVHITAAPGGYPVIEHVRRVVDGPIVWAPGIAGAAVISQRGGDFELVIGRDLSIGYLHHTASEVELYLEESVVFRLHGPDAAVPLVYAD